MNLHGIVAPAIAAVNPFVLATLKRSTGYTTADDGTRTPRYTDAPDISVQVQALSYSDLQQTGGDLFVFPVGTLPEGTTWLVAYVLEEWADWYKVAITLQNGA